MVKKKDRTYITIYFSDILIGFYIKVFKEIFFSHKMEAAT